MHRTKPTCRFEGVQPRTRNDSAPADEFSAGEPKAYFCPKAKKPPQGGVKILGVLAPVRRSKARLPWVGVLRPAKSYSQSDVQHAGEPRFARAPRVVEDYAGTFPYYGKVKGK